MAWWLVHLSLARAVQVWALARDIVLCSWARHFTLTVPLSTQVYKWVQANLILGGNPAMDKHPIQGGVEILLVASCYRNQDKLRPDKPPGLYLAHIRIQYLSFFCSCRLYSKMFTSSWIRLVTSSFKAPTLWQMHYTSSVPTSPQIKCRKTHLLM